MRRTTSGSCSHSGSRGVGNRIGSFFIELAKKDMRTWMVNLPDENLAYLPEGTEHFGDYWKAVGWAQKFAAKNRELDDERGRGGRERRRAQTSLPPFALVDVAVNCHHNYVAREHHYGADVLVTRKGAVRAAEGDLGIIPGSMGAKSFIVRGKGNRESFTRAATVRDARCHAPRRRRGSRWRITRKPPRVSNAGRTRTSLTRRQRRTSRSTT